MESQSARPFAGLLLEVSDCRHKDLYLYGSFELMVLFFESIVISTAYMILPHASLVIAIDEI